MRISRSTATSAVVLLASCASLASAAAAASKSTCLNTRSLELAQLSSCGDVVELNACFLALSDGFDRAVLEGCFVRAGCNGHDAEAEAFWTLRRCDGAGGDLKRRQGGGNGNGNGNADTSPAAGPTTGGGNAQTTARQNTNARTTAPAAAPQTTAAPAPPTTADAQQTDQTTDDPNVVFVTQTADPDSASSTSQADPNAQTTGPLVCLTTTTVSTTVCPVITAGPSKGQRGSCTSTFLTFPTCAAGLLCKADAAGNPTCMRINNSLDTAGIVIALFFAVAITATVAVLTFLCCRERRQQRKLRAKAEAAAIAAAAKETSATAGAAVGGSSRRPGTSGMRSVSANSLVGGQPQGHHSDRTPLMAAPSGPGLGGQGGGQGGAGYRDESPFADPGARR